MADLTKSPETTRVDNGPSAAAPNPDFSALSMAPHLMHSEAPGPIRHTLASVEGKWGKRTFDTGGIIKGRKVGGAA